MKLLNNVLKYRKKNNHYLFQKYLSYWHFSIAINKPLISTYNRVSLSFDSENRVADIV